MRTEERQKRLEALIEKYPKINRAKHLEDLVLCKEYLAGNCGAFETMFQSAYAKLINYVHYDNCGEHLGIQVNTQDREDLIAEAAGTAILRLDTFQGWSLFSTWMIGIARYRILTFIETRYKKEKGLVDTPVDDPKIASYMPSHIDNTTVWEILSCLPEIDATIVKRKAIERFSFSEISEEVNLPVTQIQRRYKKAIAMLRDSLSA